MKHEKFLTRVHEEFPTSSSDYSLNLAKFSEEFPTRSSTRISTRSSKREVHTSSTIAGLKMINALNLEHDGRTEAKALWEATKAGVASGSGSGAGVASGAMPGAGVASGSGSGAGVASGAMPGVGVANGCAGVANGCALPCCQPRNRVAFTEQKSELFQGNVLCECCGRFEYFKLCKAVSKVKGTWKCGSCNTKQSQLFRAFGQWPSQGFHQLSEQNKNDFMISMHGTSGSEAAAMATTLIQTFQIDQEYYADGGEYLPLSVWQTRGFDAARIEANTPERDRRICSILGPTFRVKILSTGNSGSRGSKRATAFSAAKPVVDQPPPPPQEVPPPPEEE